MSNKIFVLGLEACLSIAKRFVVGEQLKELSAEPLVFAGNAARVIRQTINRFLQDGWCFGTSIWRTKAVRDETRRGTHHGRNRRDINRLAVTREPNTTAGGEGGCGNGCR